jgi:putative ABC transport system permease protein
MTPTIPGEDLLKYGNSEYLQSAVYTAESKGRSDNLTAVDQEKGGGGNYVTSGFTMRGDGQTTEEMASRYYFYKLFANKYEEFEAGNRKLAEGSLPEKDNECMISSDLAKASGKKIGDVINIQSELEDKLDWNAPYIDIEWQLTIVGIYADITKEYNDNEVQNAYTNRRNEIFTTVGTLASKMQPGKNGITLNGVFYLKNPELLDKYTAELRAMGLSEVFDVETDTASYEKIVKPVEGLKTFSLTFVIVVLILGAVILALLSLISVRERKYEIGVLRAMGMKKAKVLLGLWLETLVIVAVCLVIGLGVGGAAAQPITNAMLEKQVEAAQSSAANNNIFANGAQGSVVISDDGIVSVNGMGASDLSTEEKTLDKLDIQIEWQTVLEMIAIALFLSSLSGIIAGANITKYEPIKILMERN